MRKLFERLMAWVWKRRAEAVAQHYCAVLVSRGNHLALSEHTSALMGFTERSGFLRDGRYPGGRHAERKIAQYVELIERHNRQITL